MPVELAARDTPKEVAGCLPDLFRVVIIAPEIVTGQIIWLGLDKAVKCWL